MRLCEFIHKLESRLGCCQPSAPVQRFRLSSGMKVQVNSEIGHLRAVLVHTPGPELLAVTPRTREDFLYDDIIEAETARREHQRFIAILERFTKVYQVRDLLEEVLHQPQARELL